MKRSPLRRVSESQRHKNVVLRKARAKRAGLADYFCEADLEVCTGHGQHAHHVVRRSQGGPDTVENLRWLCRACHDHIHANPAKAMSLGLLASSAPGRPAPTPLGDGASGVANTDDRRPGAVIRNDIDEGNVWPDEEDEDPLTRFVEYELGQMRALRLMVDVVAARLRPFETMWMSDPEAWAAAEGIEFRGDIS